DYSGGFFEEEHNQFVIELLGLSLNSQVFVSAVLDTATLFDADDGLPSWGCFNSSVTDCPRPQGGTTQDPQVPLPGTLALVGLGLAGMALRRRPPSR
ncbi:MAG: PEP-CTERM sorting domain-containing protein, partial [Burkholderiales bacterium]|nr:PEP-CTERM sorting domain-containing protein [Burkholderiales bacterium]